MKKSLLVAGLMLGLAGSNTVWADVFPYTMEIENKEVNDEYLYGSFAKCKVTSEKYPELVRTVTEWAAEKEAENASVQEKCKEQALIDAENQGDEFYGYSIFEDVSIMRADERILSLREERYQYLGDGDYPADFVSGINFDVQTGEILELNDILKNPEEFKQAAIEFIISYMWAMYGEAEMGITEEILSHYWDTDLEWYMNATGINLVFNEDTISPNIMEILEIPMTLAYANDYMKEEYVQYAEYGVYAVQENIPLEIHDEEERFSFILNVEEGENDWHYSVMAGGENLMLGQCGYLDSAYYIKKADGRHYLMYAADIASADYTTYLFELSKDGVKQKDTLFAAIDSGCINTDYFKMETSLYVLGTYSAEKTYFIDENGVFGTNDAEYTLRGDVESRFELKTTTEIPFISEDEEVLLPMGTGLRLLASDDESYVRVQISETGQIGEIPLKRGEGDDSWIIYIGEKNADDCFEMLPYVG